MQTADQERKKQQTPPSKPRTNRHKRSLFALFQRLSASDVQLSCIADPKCPRTTATLRILERRLFGIHSTTAAKFVPGHSCFVVSRAFAAPAEGKVSVIGTRFVWCASPQHRLNPVSSIGRPRRCASWLETQRLD